MCRALIESSGEALVIPAPVLVEVHHWIHRRLGPGVLVALLDDIMAGAFLVEGLVAADYRRARHLCDRYADADIGFVDASVLAVVERLDETKLATLDVRHFRTLRPRHLGALRLLHLADAPPLRHPPLLGRDGTVWIRTGGWG